jgi:hypothetical protein
MARALSEDAGDDLIRVEKQDGGERPLRDAAELKLEAGI